MQKGEKTNNSKNKNGKRQKPQNEYSVGNIKKKFQDNIVDFMKGEEKYIFNKTPIVKEKMINDKNPKRKKREKKQFSEFIREEENDQFDIMEKKTKKIKKKGLMDAEEAEFELYDENLENYFLQNENNFKQLKDVPQMKFSENTYILSRVQEKQNKQLVYNLHMNRRGFIDIENINQEVQKNDKQKLVNDFKLGEFIITKVTSSANDKVCSTLDINQLDQQNFEAGMIVSGIILNQEDYGYKVKISKDDSFSGFIKKDKQKINFINQKPQLLMVESVDIKNKIVYLSFNLKQQQNQQQPLHQQQLHIGSVVKTKIVNKLENGVMVKFGKYIGFINNINIDAKNSKENDFLNARVTIIDYNAKLIYLSNLQHILEMDHTLDKTNIKGKIVSQFKKVRVENNNYIISVDLEDQKDQIVILKKKQIDQDTEDEFKLTDKNKIIIKNVKLTDYNFMENVFLGMCRQQDMNKKEKIQDFEVGTNVNCRIKKIFKNDKNQQKIIVELEDSNLTGLLEENQQSDKGKIKTSLKEKQKIKMQIISIDSEKNRLFLTLRNQFMSQKKEEMMIDIEKCEEGKQYVGFIQKIDKQRGVIVRFYNQVNGMINLKEIESHNMKIEDFKLFKSIRVWVAKKDVSNKKISLSLSEKSANQVIKNNLHYIIGSYPIQGKQEAFECTLISQAIINNNFLSHNNTVYQLISTLPNKKGPALILAKDIASADTNFIKQQTIKSLSNLQPHQSYYGYITRQINNHLAVVNIHQGISGLISLQANQQLKLHSVIKFQLQSIDNKRNIFIGQQQLIQTNLVQLFNQKTTDQYQIGMILQCKISIMKEYGLIMDIDNNYTGVILNQNRIQDHDFKQDQEIVCRILDIDIDKKLLDLQQVSSKEKNFKSKNYLNSKLQKYKINNSSSYDCKVLLGKQDYCIVELINHSKIVGFVGIKNKEHSEIVKNVKLNSIVQDSRVVFEVSESEQFERRKDSMIGLNENSKIEAGELVIGKVIKVQSNSVFLQISKKVMARMHKVYQQKGKQYQLDEKVTLQILQVTKENKGPIQWIECIDHQNTHIDSHLQSYSLIKDNHFSNRTFKALIKTVNVNSIQPLYLELNNNLKGYVSAFNLSIHQLNNLTTLFIKDSIVDVIVLHQNNHSLFSMKIVEDTDFQTSHTFTQKSQKVYKKGDKVIVKVIKEYNNSRKIQIDETIYAKVEDIEYDDIYVQEKKDSKDQQQFMRGIVIDIKNEQYIISTRESLINDYERMMEMSTKNYKKYEQIQVINGDVRNRVIKYGQSGLQLNMLVMGIVQNISNKGCFIKIGVNLTVRGQESELENVELVKEGQLILSRVIEIKENGQIEVSNRSSIVVNGLKGIDDFKVNMKVKGRVIGFKGYVAIIQLDNTRVIAYLNVDQIDDPQQFITLQKLLKINQPITNAIVTKIYTHPKPRLQISTKQALINQNNQQQHVSTTNPQADYITELINNINHLNLSIQLIQQPSTLMQEELHNHKENNYQQEEGKDSQQDNYDHDNDDHQQNEEEEDNQNLQLEDHNDNQDIDQQVIDDESEQSEQSEQSVEQVETQKKQGKKQKKEQEMIKKELQIRKKEQQLLENDIELKQDSDYEKLILQNPNSSYFWINYIAFKMENEGIEKARNLTERGLRIVNYKNERDRLNIWNSYINLEFNFGTEQSLLTCFKKALENNNPKKIYLHLIELYRKKGDQQMMKSLAMNMVKKNKQSKKCWLEYMRIIVQGGKGEEESKQELRRSLQSIEKNKHLQYLQSYARLLFNNNKVEQGRSTMEAIITNYPRRTDLWSVYLDLEINKGSQEQIRLLFDRSTSLTLKPKKMKFLFKRYLEYESQFGTTDSILKVKNKANNYVQSIIKNQDQNEQEDEEEM